MRVKSWLKAAVLCPAFLCCLLPVLAGSQDAAQQSGTDPVADAARRSREAKQNAAKHRKIYTDDDLSRPKAAPPSDAAGTPQTAAPVPETSGNAAATDDPAKTNEAAWRKRFQEQRDRISRAEKELDVLQRETQKVQIQYYPDPQKALSEQYTRKDIHEKEAKIEAKRQEIAQLKQGLTDLEDALRKAGGDPGWAR